MTGRAMQSRPLVGWLVLRAQRIGGAQTHPFQCIADVPAERLWLAKADEAAQRSLTIRCCRVNGKRQKSECTVVASLTVGYPAPEIAGRDEGNDGLPIVPGERDTGVETANDVGLPAVSLSSLPTHLQRTHGHALQSSAGSYRHRTARGAVAAPVQAEPARLGRDVPGAWVHVHAGDGTGVGGAVLAAADRAASGHAARQSR